MRGSRRLPKPRLVDRNTAVVELARGQRVLHVGMGGFIDNAEHSEIVISRDFHKSMHPTLAKVAGRLVGLDINPHAVEAMRKLVPGDYYVGDVMGTLDIAERFDLIVFADVIEHLDDFRAALSNLRGLLAPGGALVVTTVNAYGFDAFVKMAFGYESSHEEHTCYFSWLSMKRLFEMNDLAMADFAFCHRFDVVSYDSLPHWLGHNVGGLVARLFPQYSMGVLAVGRPAAQ